MAQGFLVASVIVATIDGPRQATRMREVVRAGVHRSFGDGVGPVTLAKCAGEVRCSGGP